MPMIDARRWSHFTAMVLIGDGIMAIVQAASGRTGVEPGAEAVAGFDAVYGGPSDTDPVRRHRAGGGWNHVGDAGRKGAGGVGLFPAMRR